MEGDGELRAKRNVIGRQLDSDVSLFHHLLDRIEDVSLVQAQNFDHVLLRIPFRHLLHAFNRQSVGRQLLGDSDLLVSRSNRTTNCNIKSTYETRIGYIHFPVNKIFGDA